MTLKFSKKWGEIEVRDFLEEVLYLINFKWGCNDAEIGAVRECHEGIASAAALLRIGIKDSNHHS